VDAMRSGAPKRIAVYPGSFDPLTLGHIDVLQRGLALFDRVIMAILRNPGKEPLFDTAERVEMIGQAVKGEGDVEVDVFDGLLVDYAKRKKAQAILRGVRAISDFEYEFQMALMNRRLNPDIQTVFMMPNEAYSYVSSRLVKEVAALGGDLAGIVPPFVEQRLRKRFDRGRRG
jgi:pantetheine-phosphate adenylyltransferase